MDISGNQENVLQAAEPAYDRKKELEAFDATKAGVKGLLDAGLLTIPKIFVRPPEELAAELNFKANGHIQVPVIDLGGLGGADRRKEIVEEVRVASEKWGFFQLVNHGIPLNVLEEMIEGVRSFHEQDPQKLLTGETR